MRRHHVTLGVAIASCALAVTAAATGPIHPAITLPQPQLAALSGIDVPITGDRGKELIESAFGAAPLAELIAVARDTTGDPGVRLRAYRAIGLYQTSEAQDALRADILALGAAETGTDLLYLRAVIEALGEQHDPEDVPNLIPFINFELSRDIRAAVADALRHLGASTARAPLAARLSCVCGNPCACETSQQVRLAISRALRDLAQPQ